MAGTGEEVRGYRGGGPWGPGGEGRGDMELPTGKQTEDSGGWGLSGLRGGFQTINGYFDSMVELVGGRNGVCRYRCRYGEYSY